VGKTPRYYRMLKLSDLVEVGSDEKLVYPLMEGICSIRQATVFATKISFV
jgi:hypothetical protein